MYFWLPVLWVSLFSNCSHWNGKWKNNVLFFIMFCPLGQSRKLNGYFPFKRQTTVESSAENVSIASISTSKTGSLGAQTVCVCECVRARVCKWFEVKSFILCQSMGKIIADCSLVWYVNLYFPFYLGSSRRRKLSWTVNKTRPWHKHSCKLLSVKGILCKKKGFI